jgi:oligopeptide/dipeptide ABC transporter ATP-binding protein
MVPALHALPKGCRFADRCPKVEPGCRERPPELVQIGSASKPHEVACFVAVREHQQEVKA